MGSDTSKPAQADLNDTCQIHDDICTVVATQRSIKAGTLPTYSLTSIISACERSCDPSSKVAEYVNDDNVTHLKNSCPTVVAWLNGVQRKRLVNGIAF